MNQPTDLLRDGNAQPAETMDIAATMQRSANQLMDPRSQQFDPMAASAGIDEAMAQLGRMTEAGPAIVEQSDTTTVIEPDMTATVDVHGNLLVKVK